MAATLRLKSVAKSVSDVASPLSATDLWVRQFVVQCLSSGTNEVYLGDSTVTDTAGFLIAAGGSLAFDPNRALNGKTQQINLNEVYVVCASGETAALKILYLVEEKD